MGQTPLNRTDGVKGHGGITKLDTILSKIRPICRDGNKETEAQAHTFERATELIVFFQDID